MGDGGGPDHEFGWLLRQFRDAAGLTQEELAQQAGLSVRALSDMERGRTTSPFKRSVRLLADALHLSQSGRAQLMGALPQAARADEHGMAISGTAAPRKAEDAPDPLDVRPDQGAAAAVLPRQLPAQARHFVGRHEEMAALTALLDEMTGNGDPLVITAIGGSAGVGKTALAVYWAHRVAGRFPDGQLYVNLRGYDPDQPVPMADALAGFLRALGVPGQDIPAEAAERAARYRSLLAGRKVLVVVDNAGSAEQVRPLLPGTPGSVVIVTSRDSLAGLVARDGAQRLELQPLSRVDALSLLRALIGHRVDNDPGAAAVLAEQCSRLPLALRVAAEMATARPGIPIADLTSELGDQQRRLDLLDAGGDPQTAVRAVFSWSWRHLESDTAAAFALAGLHPGPDLDPYAVAALTDTAVDRARQLLSQLARAHLIHATAPDRYGMHDLLRAYARELAADQYGEGQYGEGQEGEDRPQAALTRLFDYYLHTAAAAMNTLYPAEQHRRPWMIPSLTPVPTVAEPAAAQAWLDAERASLMAITAHSGAPHTTIHLAATLFRYLDASGHHPEAITLHTRARRAAHGTGDRGGEATALTSLGVAAWRQGRYTHAAGQLQQAVVLYRQAEDRTGEARALHNLGLVSVQQGDTEEASRNLRRALALYRETNDRTEVARVLGSLSILANSLGRRREASDHLQQALVLVRETGDQAEVARVLGNLGLVSLQLGRYPGAIDYFQRALTLAREIGDRNVEAHALGSLGIVYLRLGRHLEAGDLLQRAVTLSRQIGFRLAEAHMMCDLGEVYLRLGRYRQATDVLQEALTLCREIGIPDAEAAALNGTGAVLLATDRPDAARTSFATALDVASRGGDLDQQAGAHNGLAQVHQAAGELGQARYHWQQALILYTGLDAPEADQVRAQFAAADVAQLPVPNKRSH